MKPPKSLSDSLLTSIERWFVDNSVDNPEREKPIKKMIAKKFECNTEFGDYVYL